MVTDKWKNKYMAIYSIYKPHTPEGLRQKDIMLLTDKEKFLNEWCSREEDYYRFSAKHKKHAENIVLTHKNSLEHIEGVAVVTIDDVLKINSIKDKLNIKD